MRKARIWAFFSLLPAILFCQEKSINLQRVDVSNLPEIQCYLTITGMHGKSVLGLSEEEIQVLIDNKLQKISSLKSALEGGEYLGVALLFDRSGSMKDALEQTKKAAINFVKRMSINDLIAVISFDDVVRIDSPFDKDKDLIEIAIKGIAKGNNTALYDAIQETLKLLESVPTKRQAVVIFSDGRDTRSKMKKEAVLEEVKNRGVPLYTIGLGLKVDENNLIELSSATGGHFFKIASPEELVLLYQNIAEQLRNQYLISFASSFGEDKNWHTLKILLKDPSGQESETQRKYFASKGPGVASDTFFGLVLQIEWKDTLFWAAIGGFLGFLAGILLALAVKMARPEISLLSFYTVGIILWTLILGGVLGALLKIM